MNTKKIILSASIIIALIALFSFSISACGGENEPACEDYTARVIAGDTQGMTDGQWEQALNNPDFEITPQIQKTIPADRVNSIPAEKILVKDLTEGQYQKLNANTISQIKTNPDFVPGAANQQELSKSFGVSGLNVDVSEMNIKTEIKNDGIVFTNGDGVKTTIKQSDLEKYSEIKTLPNGKLQLVLKEGETGTFYNDHGNDISFQGSINMKENNNFDLDFHTGDNGKVIINTPYGPVEITGDSTIYRTEDGNYRVTLQEGASIEPHDSDSTQSPFKFTAKNTGNSPLEIGIGTDGDDVLITQNQIEYKPKAGNQFEYTDENGNWNVDGMTRKLADAGLDSGDIVAENQANGDTIKYTTLEDGSLEGSMCTGGGSVGAAVVADISGNAAVGGSCTPVLNCWKVPEQITFTEDNDNQVIVLDTKGISDKAITVYENTLQKTFNFAGDVYQSTNQRYENIPNTEIYQNTQGELIIKISYVTSPIVGSGNTQTLYLQKDIFDKNKN